MGNPHGKDPKEPMISNCTSFAICKCAPPFAFFSTCLAVIDPRWISEKTIASILRVHWFTIFPYLKHDKCESSDWYSCDQLWAIQRTWRGLSGRTYWMCLCLALVLNEQVNITLKHFLHCILFKHKSVTSWWFPWSTTKHILHCLQVP